MHAQAAGYDTPIVYTARHQGMGGTAISYVSDASAAFHNPAGLQHVSGLSLLGDFSLLLGEVTGSPQNAEATRSLESNQVVAPFFLVGAAARLHPWLSAGLAVFPVASGGAQYEYTIANPAIDSTQILFFETTPLISLNVPKDRWLPGKLAFGLGYRISTLSFERKQGRADNPRLLDLEMTGTDFKGIRAGLQYQPVTYFSMGFVFRNKIRVVAKADEATVFLRQATDAELPFVLPAKFGSGMRFDIGGLGLALDGEYTLQSQNDQNILSGELDGQRTEATNVARWKNGITGRVGVEYRFQLATAHIPARLGYVFDSEVANPAYPSAFGTPPAATHSVTVGTGYVMDSWQVNLAVAHRQGSTEVSEDELIGCRFCGFAGRYAIEMTGFYLDASTDLDL
jgi:long-subunit fatty acid transport protein